MAKMKFKPEEVSMWIVLIGALNVGLASLLSFNLVESIPFVSTYANIVYGAIGIAAAFLLLKKFKIIK